MKGVIDDIILEKVCRYVQFDKKSSQISPLLQFWDPEQQPVEDGVDHGLATGHQTFSKIAPVWVQKSFTCILLKHRLKQADIRCCKCASLTHQTC